MDVESLKRRVDALYLLPPIMLAADEKKEIWDALRLVLDGAEARVKWPRPLRSVLPEEAQAEVHSFSVKPP